MFRGKRMDTCHVFPVLGFHQLSLQETLKKNILVIVFEKEISLLEY